jgi:hypothetical protein
VLVVFDQLIPVILSADKTMKRQRMILFPRASSKTFNKSWFGLVKFFYYQPECPVKVKTPWETLHLYLSMYQNRQFNEISLEAKFLLESS